jgi:hypothetical protein
MSPGFARSATADERTSDKADMPTLRACCISRKGLEEQQAAPGALRMISKMPLVSAVGLERT